MLRSVATCVLFGLVEVVANAQSQTGGTMPAGPVTVIGNAEFDQMVQSSTLLPVTPGLLATENLDALIAYLQNSAYVASYLAQHPELTDLARLAASIPNPNDPNVKRNANGNYNVTFVNSKGATQTVQNFGPGTKMAQLANSIRAATDRAAQLANYTALYNQLPASFVNPVNTGNNLPITPPIPPSQLQGASLEAIQNALDSVVSQWRTIVNMIPPPANFTGALACNLEVGANPALAEVYYGDLTPASDAACSVPSTAGIFANFNFANKGALTCIKDQGYRGTCPIFAATSAVEELIAINTGVHVNLSEQDFWEKLTLLYTSPPQLYGDGYDAGYALGNALVKNYQFAYENQWDYNPSWDHPTCPGCYEFVNTCDNYPYPGLEPGCSDSAPQAPEYCTVRIHDIECGYRPAVLSGSSPYSLGPGTQVSPAEWVVSGKKSVVGGILNIWNPTGLIPALCSTCPPQYGVGPHPDLSVDYMILALALNNTVMLGFEETDAFGGAPGGYVPVQGPCLTVTAFGVCIWGGDQTTDAGGHNIHVVGFVSNEDLAAKIPTAPPGSGGGYFILKNSWGPCAGDAGYYYMPVDYVKARGQSIYVVSGG